MSVTVLSRRCHAHTQCRHQMSRCISCKLRMSRIVATTDVVRGTDLPIDNLTSLCGYRLERKGNSGQVTRISLLGSVDSDMDRFGICIRYISEETSYRRNKFPSIDSATDCFQSTTVMPSNDAQWRPGLVFDANPVRDQLIIPIPPSLPPHPDI